MMRKHLGMLALGAAVVALCIGATLPARAQVGKGLIDPNVATEKELQALPNMTPAIVSGLIGKRPFASVLDLNAFLLEQKLTPAQATEFYRKAFVHINLDIGKAEEFMLVPGSGKRMSAEFAEYRPWKNWTQFDKEIGKYVGQQETDRFKQYMFIPINVNTAADDVLSTVPGADARVVGELKKGRPWKTKEQFDQQIGKTLGPRESIRLGRYFVVQ